MDTKEPDDNEEYEEEECLVYLDFETKFLEDQLRDPNLKMDIIGIETDNPILQVNSKLFRGTYDYAMGTNVFFTECTQPPEPDPNFREMPDKMYEYFGKTNKVLKMKRIFVEERDKCQDDQLDAELPESLENLRVRKTYGEALNQFLQPGEEPPRQIEDDEIPIEGEALGKSGNANKDSDEAETTSDAVTSGEATLQIDASQLEVQSLDNIDIENLPVVLASSLDEMA